MELVAQPAEKERKKMIRKALAAAFVFPLVFALATFVSAEPLFPETLPGNYFANPQYQRPAVGTIQTEPELETVTYACQNPAGQIPPGHANLEATFSVYYVATYDAVRNPAGSIVGYTLRDVVERVEGDEPSCPGDNWTVIIHE